MSIPYTNEDIYRYLEDLSANIANQFNELKREILIESDITNALIIDLSANVAEQFRSLERGIIQEFALTDSYILDLSANLTAQNQVTDALIYDSVIIELKELTRGLTDGLEKQTNDINTNTNTALSQYTNTINTNTNASVSTAVSILNK